MTPWRVQVVTRQRSHTVSDRLNNPTLAIKKQNKHRHNENKQTKQKAKTKQQAEILIQIHRKPCISGALRGTFINASVKHSFTLTLTCSWLFQFNIYISLPWHVLTLLEQQHETDYTQLITLGMKHIALARGSRWKKRQVMKV